MPSAGDVHERIKARLKMRLADLLDGAPPGRHAPQQRQALEAELHQVVRDVTDESRGVSLSAEDERRLIHEAIQEVLGFDLLDALLADPTINEIMINGPSELFVERDGRLEPVPVAFRDANHLMSVLERMLASANVSVNEANPVCDASLPDGTRLNVIIPPLALNGPVVTIRRAAREWTMRDYLEKQALSPQVAEFLQGCVRAKVNVVISGGTSAGKTTLVTILSASIPEQERIVTIENVAELSLPGRRHWVRLVGRPPSLDGRGEIPLRVLVKNALRMRPDRIILGEARGGEALDVVQAMHSGHDGFITVLHANSGRAALERLETMMLMSGLDLPPAACRMQIASAVDLVVHIARFVDGSRRIATVTQVQGSAEEGFLMEDLFVFDGGGFTPEGRLLGSWRYTGVRPKFLGKFTLNNMPLPSWLAT